MILQISLFKAIFFVPRKENEKVLDIFVCSAIIGCRKQKAQNQEPKESKSKEVPKRVAGLRYR
jgi:hypothetical protein